MKDLYSKYKKKIKNIVKVYQHALHENIEKLIKNHDDKLLENNKHIERIISIYELKLKENSDIIKNILQIQAIKDGVAKTKINLYFFLVINKKID